MINIFGNPKKYIDEILSNSIFSESEIKKTLSDHDGLSMICAWITKKCPLSCENCFFKSNMDCKGMLEEEHTLSEEGIKKLIRFANDSNNGYLMLSGGGDPMVCHDKVEEIIKYTKTKRIVIVTSGFWAGSYDKAKMYIDSLYNALQNKTTNDDTVVILRISIDEYHKESLGGINQYINIVNVFKDNYRDDHNFKLMMHTMRNDAVVHEVADKMGAEIKDSQYGESDNENVIKIVPQKAIFQLDSKYQVEIGISKLFVSNLLVDLNEPYSIHVKDAIKVLADDMENSEQDNPSYIQNANGKKGLDFWIDYNGNVTTWFNQDWYNLFNLYTDKYEDIVSKTINYPISARFLKKGYQYRNSIVNEVNPKALLRSQAMNLRDYMGAFLLEEDKTKLYYAIRCIQDYISEYILDDKDIELFSQELQDMIRSDRSILIDCYKKSEYDILSQYLIGKDFDEQEWEDMFTLINLGHYDIDSKHLKYCLDIYKEKTNQKNAKLTDFVVNGDSEEYGRFHKRVSFMKASVLNHCKRKVIQKEYAEVAN